MFALKRKRKRIAINGFGRIGRAIVKINQQYNYFNLVLINDINPHIDNLAYLLKYDSTYGKFPSKVGSYDDGIVIDGHKVVCTSYDNLRSVPWERYDIDILIDSSGVGSNVQSAKEITDKKIIGKVIVTHSNDATDNEVVMGVNDNSLLNEHRVVSNSICDANAIAHIMNWLDDEYGISSGSLTTMHPWLSYQNLVDGPAISQKNPGVVWTDYALGRASSDSLIPKDTTAMHAVEKILPNLKGKVMSLSYRIPTDIVASSDITLNLNRSVDKRELKIFLESKCDNSHYVRINTESLISLDYEKEEVSAIIDMQWLTVKDNLVKIVLWYDNEWGYSARVLDLAQKMMKLDDLS